MEIQEIKIDGITYIPSKSKNCNACEFKDKYGHGCFLKDFEPFFTDHFDNYLVCDLFNRQALQIKEEK